jgi:CO/xanthine dehydrogenase Mo-binding subunit
MDKLEFRKKNLLSRERPQASGTIMRDAAVAEVLDEVARQLDWSTPIERGTGNIRRGRGIAVGIKGITSPTTSVAIVNLSGDGSCFLSMGTVDMGQGSDTVMAQIAAEVLGIAAESVRVVHPDTDVTPYDMGTLGSRSTFHMGTAVRLAAEEAKQKVEVLRAELGEVAKDMSPSQMLRTKYGMQAGNIIGTGSFIPGYEKPDTKTGQTTKGTPFWGVGATGAEVEVDIETGWVTVKRVINIIDPGQVLNPRLVKQQISGAAIMQLGFTFTENMVFKDGQLTNGSLADYKIPNIIDMPRDWVCEWVDSTQQDGPFGAKGAGEFSSIALSPAIGNAVADAIGIPLFDLPITPEGVYRALQAQKSQLKDEAENEL